LAEKLLRIRTGLDLSQSQMYARLNRPDVPLDETYISQYESGRREPPLQTLLAYAHAAGVPVELLIDDERELPTRLPATGVFWVMKDGRIWKQRRDKP
jgi:transcriptional regulator with XRE-family HTH domain